MDPHRSFRNAHGQSRRDVLVDVPTATDAFAAHDPSRRYRDSHGRGKFPSGANAHGFLDVPGEDAPDARNAEHPANHTALSEGALIEVVNRRNTRESLS